MIIRYLPDAFRDLNEALTYYGQRSPDAAQRFVDAIRAEEQTILDFPNIAYAIGEKRRVPIGKAGCAISIDCPKLSHHQFPLRAPYSALGVATRRLLHLSALGQRTEQSVGSAGLGIVSDSETTENGIEA